MAASLATSCFPATRPGTRRDRRGTSPSTSGRSPSSTRSRPTTSPRPSGFAAEHGLRIAFNAGGHNAGPIDWSRDHLLLKTERMDGIEIDAEARRARVEAGVLSQPLAVAAAEHGLAYLAGTSPNVGVFGYALGGGLSWMIRTLGLACNSIVAAEVVTADGRRVRRRPRHGTRAVLGASGRRRQRRRGDRDRARAVPHPGDLRRRPVLADRARHGDPQRLARRGSRPCPTRASPSGGCSSCPTSRSCPSTCAAARSSWSSRVHRRAPPTATPSSSRCGTSSPSSTRSG